MAKTTYRKKTLPLLLSTFIGQPHLLKKVNVLIEKSKTSKEAIPHLLFAGQNGMGKRTLATLMAQELGVNIFISPMSSIENTHQFCHVVTSLKKGDIWLLTDIDNMKSCIKDYFYQAIQEFQLSLALDDDTSIKRYITANLHSFTLIGTVSDLHRLDPSLRKIFFTECEFISYHCAEIFQILQNIHSQAKISFEAEALHEISEKAKGCPEEAVLISQKLQTYANLAKVPTISLKLVREFFDLFVSNVQQEPEHKSDRWISPQVKREVWRRDQGRCVYCQSQDKLEFDHIIPFSKGGSHTARNIQVLCETCNRRKRDHI